MQKPSLSPLQRCPGLSRAGVWVATLTLTACVAPKTPSDKQAAPRKPKVALIMKSLANEFFQTMEAGAKAHHAAHRQEYDLLTNGIKDEQDIGKQMDLVGQMVARGVDAIVLAPADSKALITAAKRALAAGVVVVNIDNKLDATILSDKGLRISFVGPSNRMGARLAGAHLAANVERGAKVVIIEGVPTAENARERRLGFEDAIKEANLHLIATQAANWEMGKANQIVSALLNEHPDLRGILCANDTMALGAVAAVKAAGKANQIHIVGFDNVKAANELVRNNSLLATVEQHGDQLAVFGIEYALDLLAQRAPPADKQTPVQLVTREALQ